MINELANRIYSKYALINETTGVIELLETSPKSNGFYLIIEDCILEFDENKVCKITGNKWEWGFVLENTFLCNLKYGVIDKHTKLGYRTLFDRFKGIQSAYVDGWHRKSENKLYKAVVSKFFIVL